MAWAYNTSDDAPTDAPRIITVAIVFTALSLLAVCLRLYVRLFIVKAYGWDDFMIIVAWFGSLGYSVSTIVQTRWGQGLQNLDDMPLQNMYNFSLTQYIGAPFIWAFKMSLLLFYLRITPGSHRIAPICIAVIITMAHIAFVCVFMFSCDPIAKQWDAAITYGSCIDAVAFYLTFSSLTIVFDVVIMALPFPVLLKSQMQTRKKLVLLGLFALGIFVTIIQIIRIQTIQNLKNYLDSSKAITWSMVEDNIGIIITCVPTLAPLFKYFSEKSRKGSYKHGPYEPATPSSKYALQTWGSGSRAGKLPLGGKGNVQTDTCIIAAHNTDSTEMILDVEGITMRTDVHVTTQSLRGMAL